MSVAGPKLSPVLAAVSAEPAELAYCDQSAHALCYRLYRGCPDLAPLQIVAQREVQVAPGLHATLTVLGASHAVCWRTDDGASLTELLACGEPPPGEVVDSFVLGGEGALACRSARDYVVGALRLGVSTRVEPDRNQSGPRIQSLDADPRLRGRLLLASFPPDPAATSGPRAQPPLTCVWVDPAEPCIRTIHSYPSESLWVTTETRVVPAARVV